MSNKPRLTKKAWLTVVILLFGVGVPVWLGLKDWPTSSTASGPGVLVLKDNGFRWDEPDQEFDANAASMMSTLELENIGGQAVQILDVSSPLGCLKTTVSRQSVQPGKSLALRLKMDLSQLDQYSAIPVVVKTDLRTTPQLEFSLDHFLVKLSQRSPRILSLYSELVFYDEYKSNTGQCIYIRTLEPGESAGHAPIVTSNQPYIKISQPQVRMSEQPHTSNIQCEYQYKVELQDPWPQMGFSAEIQVEFPWKPRQIKRLNVTGNNPRIQVVPKLIVLEQDSNGFKPTRLQLRTVLPQSSIRVEPVSSSHSLSIQPVTAKSLNSDLEFDVLSDGKFPESGKQEIAIFSLDNPTQRIIVPVYHQLSSQPNQKTTPEVASRRIVNSLETWQTLDCVIRENAHVLSALDPRYEFQTTTIKLVETRFGEQFHQATYVVGKNGSAPPYAGVFDNTFYYSNGKMSIRHKGDLEAPRDFTIVATSSQADPDPYRSFVFEVYLNRSNPLSEMIAKASHQGFAKHLGRECELFSCQIGPKFWVYSLDHETGLPLKLVEYRNKATMTANQPSLVWEALELPEPKGQGFVLPAKSKTKFYQDGALSTETDHIVESLILNKDHDKSVFWRSDVSPFPTQTGMVFFQTSPALTQWKFSTLAPSNPSLPNRYSFILISFLVVLILIGLWIWRLKFLSKQFSTRNP